MADAIIGALATIAAAFFAAIAGVMTWFLTTRGDVKEKERLRQERIDDIVRAVHAEIVTGIVLYQRQIDPIEVNRTINDTSPFATPDETDFVFNSIKDEISILPSEVVHSVVAYYRVAQQTNLIIRDFRDADFKRQSLMAKQRFLSGYIALIEILKHRGDRAAAKLSEYAHERGFDEKLDRAKEELNADTNNAMEHARQLLIDAQKPSRRSKSRPAPVKRASNHRKDRASHR